MILKYMKIITWKVSIKKKKNKYEQQSGEGTGQNLRL